MFITFEGLDGSGKTTQVGALAAHLRALGHNVLLTREPGGTEIGDQLRRILHDMKHNNMHAHTELLLFAASRAQLVAQVIRPHLERGGLVISDRFSDSTIAYQGYGHGIDIDIVQTVVWVATNGLQPDLTLYLDITPENGLGRRQQASLFGDEWTRIDNMELEFHRRVQQGYRDLISSDPERFVEIDANRAEDAIKADILLALQQRLGLAV